MHKCVLVKTEPLTLQRTEVNSRASVGVVKLKVLRACALQKRMTLARMRLRTAFAARSSQEETNPSELGETHEPTVALLGAAENGEEAGAEEEARRPYG